MKRPVYPPILLVAILMAVTGMTSCETGGRPDLQAAIRKNVEFTLVSKKRTAWLFRITNHSSKSIELTTVYMPGGGMPFTPRPVVEYLEGNNWKPVPVYALDMFDYPFILEPGRTVDFRQPVACFRPVPKNAEVRLNLNQFYSESFKLD